MDQEFMFPVLATWASTLKSADSDVREKVNCFICRGTFPGQDFESDFIVTVRASRKDAVSDNGKEITAKWADVYRSSGKGFYPTGSMSRSWIDKDSGEKKYKNTGIVVDHSIVIE